MVRCGTIDGGTASGSASSPGCGGRDLEALLPASVLVELCKELKGIGDQVQVEIDTHEVAFEGMWRWCWRAAAAIAG